MHYTNPSRWKMRLRPIKHPQTAQMSGVELDIRAFRRSVNLPLASRSALPDFEPKQHHYAHTRDLSARVARVGRRKIVRSRRKPGRGCVRSHSQEPEEQHSSAYTLRGESDTQRERCTAIRNCARADWAEILTDREREYGGNDRKQSTYFGRRSVTLCRLACGRSHVRDGRGGVVAVVGRVSAGVGAGGEEGVGDGGRALGGGGGGGDGAGGGEEDVAEEAEPLGRLLAGAGLRLRVCLSLGAVCVCEGVGGSAGGCVALGGRATAVGRAHLHRRLRRQHAGACSCPSARAVVVVVVAVAVAVAAAVVFVRRERRDWPSHMRRPSRHFPNICRISAAKGVVVRDKG
ncbi:hypothetical protein C8Q78DRAFT_446324 [Trametes maxima]|nr:hypothetical protein C8Q78DRAFT_446324 [Trametes maxima]